MNTSAVQPLLGVMVVFALIGACAWLAHRLRSTRGAAGGMVRLVGGTMVGARERVVVVEVNDTWIVLGVAPGRVNALHTLPRGAPANELDAAAKPSQAGWSAFAALLRQRIEKSNAKPVSIQQS